MVREDGLGLDVIYVWAKREDPACPVGRPDIQPFAGACGGRGRPWRVHHHVDGFSRQAQDFTGSLAVRLILIDGDELARLMIELGVGVTVRQTYELKRVDEDYFTTNIS